MFESLADLPRQTCRSRYDRVRAEIDAVVAELPKKDLILQILWEHGGRCDCTVGHAIVARAEVNAIVQDKISETLSAAAPAHVEPYLHRTDWHSGLYDRFWRREGS